MKKNIFSVYNDLKRDLKAAGIEDFAFEARQILRYVTGYSNSEIMSRYNEEIPPMKLLALNSISGKRKSHYPLQYILGEWSFYGLDFYVGDGVLCPRADTETLVDCALEMLKGKHSAKILDLCSGSGCVAIAVEKNTENAEITAIEKYDKAFSYLEKNINRHSSAIKAVKADIFSAFYDIEDGSVDLLLSNPPYISAEEMCQINKEAEFEPDTALYGGEDGLLFYRLIAEKWLKKIRNGGGFAVEIGFSQADAVKEIFKSAGATNLGVKSDFGGNLRVVFGTVEKV